MVEEALGGGGAGGLGLRDRALRERGLLEEGEKEGLGIGRPKALGEGRESIGAKARRKSGRVKEVVDREWDDEKAQGEQAEIRADLQNLRVRRVSPFPVCCSFWDELQLGGGVMADGSAWLAVTGLVQQRDRTSHEEDQQTRGSP